MLQIQANAPMMLNVMNCLNVMQATPAITGENVRITGMNWARMIVPRPYFS